MNRHFIRAGRNTLASRQRQAFSLVEMLVALAIFSVLLAAVFIPIKIAGDLSGVGTARANTQQAAVDAIRQMRTDIVRAIAILPNSRMAGVTDVFPYTPENDGLPYLRDPSGYTMPTTATGSGTSDPDACRTGTIGTTPASNTARLDLILPATNTLNTIDPNIRTNSVLISYYARRRDMTKAFDPIESPVVLYRAQIPFQYTAPTPNATPEPFRAWEETTATYTSRSVNADLSNQRFTRRTSDCPTKAALTKRGLQWLTMNQYGEFDLTRLCLPPAGTSTVTPANAAPVFGSHQLVLPRDTALLTPNGAPYKTGTPPTMGTSSVPDTTFICADANKDGKIDAVTIQLSVGQYDKNSVNRRENNTGAGSTLRPQTARTVTETVVAANVR